MKLAFRRSSDHCCELCNWPALADLETECVRVEVEGAEPRTRGRSICLPCIDALTRARTRRVRAVYVDLHPELVGFLSSDRPVRKGR